MPKRSKEVSSDDEVDQVAHVRSEHRPLCKIRKNANDRITLTFTRTRNGITVHTSSEDVADSTATELGSTLEPDSEVESPVRESSPCAVEDFLERRGTKSPKSPSPFPASTYWSDPKGKAKDHRQYGEMIKRRSESDSDCDADDELDTQPIKKKCRMSPSPVAVVRHSLSPPPSAIALRAITNANALVKDSHVIARDPSHASKGPKAEKPRLEPRFKLVPATRMERSSSAESQSSARSMGVSSMTAGFENLRAVDEDTEMMETDTESEDDKTVSASLAQLPSSPSSAPSRLSPPPAQSRTIRPLPVRQPGRTALQRLLPRRRLKRTRASLARQDNLEIPLPHNLPADDDQMVTSEVELEMQIAQHSNTTTVAQHDDVDVDYPEPGQPSAKLRRVGHLASSGQSPSSNEPLPLVLAMAQRGREQRRARRVMGQVLAWKIALIHVGLLPPLARVSPATFARRTESTWVRRRKRDVQRLHADRARRMSRPEIELLPPPITYPAVPPVPVYDDFVEAYEPRREADDVVEIAPFHPDRAPSVFLLDDEEELEDYFEETVVSIEDEDFDETLDEDSDGQSISFTESVRSASPVRPASPAMSDPPSYDEVPDLVPTRMPTTVTRRFPSQSMLPAYDPGNPVAGGAYSRRSPTPAPPYNAQTDCQTLDGPHFDPVPHPVQDALAAPVPRRPISWASGILTDIDNDVLPIIGAFPLVRDGAHSHQLADPRIRAPAAANLHEVEVERMTAPSYDAGTVWDVAPDMEEGQWEDDDVEGALDDSQREEQSDVVPVMLGAVGRLIRTVWRW